MMTAAVLALSAAALLVGAWGIWQYSSRLAEADHQRHLLAEANSDLYRARRRLAEQQVREIEMHGKRAVITVHMRREWPVYTVDIDGCTVRRFEGVDAKERAEELLDLLNEWV